MGGLVTGDFEGLGVGLRDGGGVAAVLVVVVVVVVVVLADVVVVVVPAVVVEDPLGSSPQSHKGGLLSHGQYCDS